MFGGAWLTIGGIGGELIGAGLTTTGLGALIGVPAMAVSAGLVAGGMGNMAAGLHGFSDALMMEGGGDSSSVSKYPRDFASSKTKFYSARYSSEREARAFARNKLGKDPVQVAPGKLRSQDGRWQYRGKPEDLEGHGPTDSPHIHLEHLDPATGEVLKNWHLRWL
jgi:hypothetical protein